MRVLQILPELNLGGVEKGTVELAKYLVFNGHHAIVISNGGRLERELQEFGIKHYKLAVNKKSPFSLLLVPKIVSILRKEQVEILHARSRVPAILAYLAFKVYIRRQNIIKFLHFVPSFITTAHGYYRKHIFSNIMAKGKFVICPSKVIAKHMLEDFNLPLERIRIIPRGVDLSDYEFILPSQRDWKHPVIAIIARLTPIKGQIEFIKAFREVLKIKPFAKAWVIGSPSKGKEGYVRDLMLLVKRYGLENMVEFLGLRSDIPELLKKINILVQPSKIPEAFGRVVIEAQACGVLVIASSLGGYREIIEDGKTGFLVTSGDDKKLAQVLIRLIKSHQDFDSLALSARAHVEMSYNLERMHRQTLQVYEEAGKNLGILILKLGALGDVILSIPSIRAIRRKFPQAKLYLLTSDKVAKVFRACPYLDRLFIYSDSIFKYRALFQCLKNIKKFMPEISIDLQNNRITRLIAYLAGIYQRYGFINGKFSFLLNRACKLPTKPTAPVDQQLILLNLLGIRSIDKDLELWPEEEEIKKAEDFLDAHWLSKKQMLIGINIGSSKRWSSKRWSIKKIIELIDELGYYNIRVLITGEREDKQNAIKIVNSCKNRPIDMVAKTDISLLIAVIKKCHIFLTSDSAPLHIAAAIKTPVLALFGPTDPNRHLPPGENVYFLWKKIDCSPCYKSECNKKNNCLDAITVAEVKAKILEILKEKVESSNIKQSF